MLEHAHAVEVERDAVGVEPRVAAVERRGAGRGEDAAPVRVAPVQRGLHERRRRDPARDRLRLVGGRGAGDADLRDDGRALAVGDDLRGELGADVVERGGERVVVALPEAPFASRSTASFVEHSPSTEIALKLRSTAGRRNSSASPGSSG